MPCGGSFGNRSFGRRSFLVAALAAPLQRRVLDPHAFQLALKGPILSAPTVFDEQFRIDHRGLRNMVERGFEGGVRIFALTKGNSMYDSLTYDEVKELTRSLVEVVAGRGMMIAATGAWWTGQVVDYARFAESAGANALQVLIPPNAGAEALVAHFRAIARSTRLPLILHGQPSLDVLRRLLEIEELAAMKEEFTTDYTVPIYQEFNSRLRIFAGGTKARLLTYRPYGMQAYYSAFATFAPEIAMRFWKAVESNRTGEARDVVLRYDAPFFRRWNHSFWRATLEYFGVARRYLRPPDPTFANAEMKEVREFYTGLGLKSAASQ
jgi:4-hydroxy-tetrahydrodipicolinate synthase